MSRAVERCNVLVKD
jgi:hypothetical protein